mmetsp:Transcript_51277/g.91659  ORF Transcript_51277/g.91659 Transcript_51277/m.91659 type:complete len:90 (-) Transcript_51277:154-423(-)
MPKVFVFVFVLLDSPHPKRGGGFGMGAQAHTMPQGGCWSLSWSITHTHINTPGVIHSLHLKRLLLVFRIRCPHVCGEDDATIARQEWDV